MTKLFKDLMKGFDEVDAFLAGQTAGYKVTLPAEVDVKGIRKRLKMTQARFSSLWFLLDAVKHWEGGRRTPESSARAFLTVIAKDPTPLSQPCTRNSANSAPSDGFRFLAKGRETTKPSRILSLQNIPHSLRRTRKLTLEPPHALARSSSPPRPHHRGQP